jgi:hypothetical protein
MSHHLKKPPAEEIPHFWKEEYPSQPPPATAASTCCQAMAYVYFFRPDLYQERYNCSAYKVDDIPLEQRQHIPVGIFFLGCGLIMEVIGGCHNGVKYEQKQECCPTK